MYLKRIAVAASASLLSITAAMAQESTPTIEEMWQIIQQQQAQIEALQAEVEKAREENAQAEQRLEMTESQIEATGEFVEQMAEVQSEPSRTSIGGYGELHYNNYLSSDIDDEIDFHRFVLYFGHEFNDRVRLFSELELEHALSGDGKPGEVELEQAYIDFKINDHLNVMGGLFLVPVGILNETHEPDTFYGVERNSVENVIIPTTWWEAGAAAYGNFENGLSWHAAITSGLEMPTQGSSAFRVRSGRQKVAEALANDPAYTFRLRYTGLPGLELAATYQYQSDPSQAADDGLDSGQLFSAHARWTTGPFSLTGLYGAWDFSGDAVEAAGADKQTGWYLEPSWRFNEHWGIYARYEDVEGARDRDHFTQHQFGINYWPVPNVVVKLDYRDRQHDLLAEAGRDFDAIDLGIGYSFY